MAQKTITLDLITFRGSLKNVFKKREAGGVKRPTLLQHSHQKLCTYFTLLQAQTESCLCPLKLHRPCCWWQYCLARGQFLPDKMKPFVLTWQTPGSSWKQVTKMTHWPPTSHSYRTILCGLIITERSQSSSNARAVFLCFYSSCLAINKRSSWTITKL